MSHVTSNRIAGIGFWSAILAGAMNLWFFLSFIPSQSTLTSPWPGPADYAASFKPWLFLAWMIPMFLLAPLILIMMVCVHKSTKPKKQTWSFPAVVLATVYASVLTPFYFVQMTVIRFHVADGAIEGLSLWLHAYYYPYNIGGAVEAVGYSFVSVSYLLISRVFGEGRLQRWARRAFVVAGVTGLPLFIDPLVRLPMDFLIIDAAAYAISGTLAPVFLAILFRRGTISMETATQTQLENRGKRIV